MVFPQPPTSPVHVGMRTPIWLDCDTGHDDAFAILLAGRSSDVRFLGISTVHGNAPLEKTTYNTRAILKSIEREDVPVYAGASTPLSRDPAHAPDIHGKSGLDGTMSLPEPTVPALADKTAVDAMYDALRAEKPGTAWLVATAALTNVALLFRTYPDLAQHIAGLSIMGGAIGGGFTDAPMGKVKGEGERFGNHTSYAEFNIYCDPEAASEIFSSPALACKITLIPLDLTHQFVATNEVRFALLFGYGSGSKGCEPTMEQISNLRRLFFEILTFFAKTYREVFGFHSGPPTHDPLAVVAAFAPHLFGCAAENELAKGELEERFSVSVITEGEHGDSEDIRNGPSQCGRTVVSPVQSGNCGVRIPRTVDAREVWRVVESCLSRTENSRKRGAPLGSNIDPHLSSAPRLERLKKEPDRGPDSLEGTRAAMRAVSQNIGVSGA